MAESRIYYSAPKFDHSISSLPPINNGSPNTARAPAQRQYRHKQQPQTARKSSISDRHSKPSRLVVERLRPDKTKDLAQVVATGDIYHKGLSAPTTSRRRNHIDNQFDIKDKSKMRDELLPDNEFVKRIFYTMANRQAGAIDEGQFEESACVVFGRVNGIELDDIPEPARHAHGLMMEKIPKQSKMTLENFHIALIAAGYFMLMKPLFLIRKFATIKEFENLASNLGIEGASKDAALKELDPRDTGRFSLRDFVWWAANKTGEGEFVLDLAPFKALSVSTPRRHEEKKPREGLTYAGRCAVSPKMKDLIDEKEMQRRIDQLERENAFLKSMESQNNNNRDDDKNSTSPSNNSSTVHLPPLNLNRSPQANQSNNNNNNNSRSNISNPFLDSVFSEEVLNNANSLSSTPRSVSQSSTDSRNNNNGGGQRGGKRVVIASAVPQNNNNNNNDDDDQQQQQCFSMTGLSSNDDNDSNSGTLNGSHSRTTGRHRRMPRRNNNNNNSTSIADASNNINSSGNSKRRYPGQDSPSSNMLDQQQHQQQQDEEEQEDPHVQTQPKMQPPAAQQQEEIRSSPLMMKKQETEKYVEENDRKEDAVAKDSSSNNNNDDNDHDDSINKFSKEQNDVSEEPTLMASSTGVNAKHHSKLNTKNLGVVEEKESIYGDKYVVRKERGNSITRMTPTQKELISNNRQQQPAPPQQTTTTTPRASSNHHNVKRKSQVQVQHHHQPTTGRYKKKGKLQEIL